jgi:hypothetical protein
MASSPPFPPRGRAVMPPPALPLALAIEHSAPLSRLADRLRRSEACMTAVQGLLPEALRPQVRAGPHDDGGWTLIAANPSVAAKLRQLRPSLEQRLAESGLTVPALRIHVGAG